MSTFGITVDLGALRATLDATNADFAAAARPAAQAGAQVLYDEVKRNVGRIKRKTGNLAASIYQAYSQSNSRQGGVQTYHISWNAKKAPHGHLVEFGHLQRYEVTFDPKSKRFTTHKDRTLPAPRQVAARPFIRPAIARLPEAEQAMAARFIAELSARGVLR